MNKKTNSLIFMLVATAVNILLLCVFFILGLIVLNLIAAVLPDDSSIIAILMVVMFVGVIVLSFFVYSKLAKWVIKKFDLEEKLDPIFSNKNNRRNRLD